MLPTLCPPSRAPLGIQLTTAQVKTLINHQDSVYIKAIGFMYLRHVCDPKQLWGWLKPYVGNNEKFSELDDGSQTTLGSFLKKILLEQARRRRASRWRLPPPLPSTRRPEPFPPRAQEFYDCVLPRLPVPVLREMQKEIDGAGGGGGGGGSDARWEGRRDSRDERPAREERREERPSSSYRDLDQAPGGRDYDRREREDYRRDERRYDEREREGRGGGYDGGRRDDYRGGYERYDERERQQASYARPSHGDGRYGGDAPRAESRPAYPDNSTGRSAGYGDRPASYGESRPTSYERPSSYGDERRDRRDEVELQAKRARTDAPPAPKAETAAEKLARLRAKQASLGGTGHFGRVGADYAGSSNSTAPAKGIQRYQQMMKDGRA